MTRERRSWLREPLLHFVLLGAALFALNAWVGGDDAIEREDEVVVSAGRIESMTAIFARTWQRPPSPAELKGLIDDFVLVDEEAIADGVRRVVRHEHSLVEGAAGTAVRMSMISGRGRGVAKRPRSLGRGVRGAAGHGPSVASGWLRRR